MWGRKKYNKNRPGRKYRCSTRYWVFILLIFNAAGKGCKSISLKNCKSFRTTCRCQITKCFWDFEIFVVNSEFIYGIADMTIDSFAECNGRIEKGVSSSKSVRRVLADDAFTPSKARRFRVEMVEQ